MASLKELERSSKRMDDGERVDKDGPEKPRTHFLLHLPFSARCSPGLVGS